MEQLHIQITIDPALYTRNPETTELGRNIVCKSIEMIDELGFEKFTFKKLGIAINSNESSIYRYFDSKHTLLVYLTSWYWSWVEYKLVFSTTNVPDPDIKLKNALALITKNVTQDNSVSYVNEILLHRIIISESAKAYHTKDVDKENAKGFYKTYKRVVQRISDIVLEINPNYAFPHMLISTVIEGAHHQRYFSKHLPALTNVEEGQNTIEKFYTDMVFKAIN
ncbi:TetR family transcriptional regulator [Dokdonia sp. Hel_I_63]|jgi:AcrR family transcriptional regulator|uniref:TetR/AcrR family transcriptional regulator n=1 Tax=unclassified Dokdonia TaxID=2615033 RepID=UPI00020A6F31|nr:MULTISPECIES: TetR family transcriptional regulator [unclassified Dokdonia]AEE18571.1 regulatory protein TetR [Dokdonia sp. 4H-3-7-5]TVZ22199.1 TetR family transcriptional regulator [Dokdonia sp. Hel_I_63]